MPSQMQLCLDKQKIVTVSHRLGSSMRSQHENYIGPILNNVCILTPKKPAIIFRVFV